MDSPKETEEEKDVRALLKLRVYPSLRKSRWFADSSFSSSLSVRSLFSSSSSSSSSFHRSLSEMDGLLQSQVKSQRRREKLIEKREEA